MNCTLQLAYRKRGSLSTRELLIGISREARLRVIELGKNWNHFLILGCILLLGGVLAITLPLMTRYDADQVIGWTFLVCGFFQLFQALRVHGSTTFRWWLVFGALLVLLAWFLERWRRRLTINMAARNTKVEVHDE